MRLYKITLIILVIMLVGIQQTPTYYVINYVAIPAFLLTLSGFIYQFTHKSIFGYLAIAGFVVFLPIGVLGVLSIRDAMDEQSKLKFIRKLKNG
ncbi:hypothetical protein NQT69_16310 [Pseudoalteromonas shioyasakiensis]|uniref:hypothetical protein n=1 Tax=Pseudoalteromonas shioyasakiensis TaxID=1190813 RepID=UPI002117E438|nr:hypothetical protein [Pseudoalteromonas shioyasakiensis]MCQ8879567.1 hypothetical protein [Pseudoalteromonas shioyasakiensis]